MRKATIRSTGSYAPEQVIPNSYFNEQLQEDVDTWLRENLNIRERRWCYDHESVADLCERASRQALERADLTPENIDLIIVATDTPEFISPSTASVLQHRLQALNAGTFDINTACAGFVTALDVAARYIMTDDRYRQVLVVGGYTMSKHLNHADKKTVTLFADGAGAVILSSEAAEPGKAKGFLTGSLRTRGEYHSWMGIYGGGTRQPVNEEVLAKNDHKLKFVRRFPKEINPAVWSKMILESCDYLQITPNQVDHFLFTQLNYNLIHETLNRLNQPHHKAHTIMQRYGYTGSACIPMALHDAVEKSLIQRGDLLFLIGSGGGLAFACAAIRY